MPGYDIYIRSDTGEAVTYEYYHSVVQLLKTLYCLRVIDEHTVLKIITQFHPLFVQVYI